MGYNTNPPDQDPKITKKEDLSIFDEDDSLKPPSRETAKKPASPESLKTRFSSYADRESFKAAQDKLPPTGRSL